MVSAVHTHEVRSRALYRILISLRLYACSAVCLEM